MHSPSFENEFPFKLKQNHVHMKEFVQDLALIVGLKTIRKRPKPIDFESNDTYQQLWLQIRIIFIQKAVHPASFW